MAQQATSEHAMTNAGKTVDGSPLILKLRRIKSAWEIAQLENTAEMTRKTFEYMRANIQPGLTEMEFAGMFETYARKLGHGASLRVKLYSHLHAQRISPHREQDRYR